MSKCTYLLTGDIGGTNSRLKFYESLGDNKLLVEHTYRNAVKIPDTPTDTSYQECVIVPFLEKVFEELKLDVKDDDSSIIACLACAGPVMNNAVKMSNLNNCLIDGNAIQNYAMKTNGGSKNKNNEYLAKIQSCTIINDFVAQGYGCLTLKPEEMKHLHGPKFSNKLTGPKVCVGAGTGLGECYLTPDNDGIYTCFPSEGGHVEYSPRTDIEIEMFKYLRNKYDAGSTVTGAGRISVERVVSGKGLANVFQFLLQKFPDKVNEQIRKEFAEAGDVAAKVVAVNTEKDELCKQAMDIMMSAYGCEVGCAAIKFIPTGGLFITGGLTPKNIHHIEPKDSKFLEAYKDKGRVTQLLDLIPTYAVMVEDLGVRGAMKCAKMRVDEIEDLAIKIMHRDLT